ncbi:hypothetical protein EVAR_36560_1 [Eumeta japonica]|uniref:Uncharacterized protein n=1 Tax=Eumeta variegata TaxID=151549 RepID=A0A4C1XYV7_EUMVA|nr:hypothetical protein EVAR_36560_1 [Eumeta japonica]
MTDQDENRYTIRTYNSAHDSYRRVSPHLGLLVFTSARFWFSGFLAVWRRLNDGQRFLSDLTSLFSRASQYDGWLATVPDAPLPLHFIGGACVAHCRKADLAHDRTLSQKEHAVARDALQEPEQARPAPSLKSRPLPARLTYEKSNAAPRPPEAPLLARRRRPPARARAAISFYSTDP